MSTFKKAKVVMLPTNEKTKIINTNQGLLYNSNDYIGINQHLYIISDDEIKENGTHFYNPHSGQLHISGNHTDYKAVNNNGCKKIIATTDTSLYIHQKETISLPERVFYLPQPSQQFIQKFVEEYNKGNIITDVMVEYINYPTPQKDGFSTKYSDNITLTGSWASRLKQWEVLNNTLKINPKDNTITIKKVKDNYTREEVLKIAMDCMMYGYNGLPNNLTPIQGMNKWIEENL